jgi:hypothetical protein
MESRKQFDAGEDKTGERLDLLHKGAAAFPGGQSGNPQTEAVLEAARDSLDEPGGCEIAEKWAQNQSGEFNVGVTGDLEHEGHCKLAVLGA